MKCTEVSTILKTLAPEAAAVLNHSVSDASRRRHAKTTPLHVAATLLSAPSSLFRQACLRSHTTEPLHSRALDLCFSVALTLLPTTTTTTTTQPSPSNALTAVLKRAQAQLRRSSHDHLDTRIELDHLVVSILDDPTVSRVMREASFSSLAVKAYIEQLLVDAATMISLTQPQSSLCAACMQSYKLELANLGSETVPPGLSNWLQIAAPPLPNNDAQSKTNQLQNKELLMRKWVRICTSSSSLINDGFVTQQSSNASLPVRRPASPVQTYLVLGQPNKASDINDGAVNSDSLKRVFHGSTGNFSWQEETVEHPAKYRRVATLHRPRQYRRREEDNRS